MRFTIVVCLMAALIAELFSPVSAVQEIVLADEFIDLQLKKNLNIGVRLHLPERNRSSEQFLLSINGENLRSYSLKQIKEKLSGPLDTFVDVEIGYPSGHTEVHKLQRQPSRLHKIRTQNFDPMHTLQREFLYRLNGNPSHVNMLEKSWSNVDLITKSTCIRAARDCANESDQNRNVNILLNCMLLSQSIGDFDSSDLYLSRALDSMKAAKVPATNINFYHKDVVQNLISLGKSNEAETFCKYLLEPAPNHIARHPLPVTVLESYSLIPTVTAKSECRNLADSILSGNSRQLVLSNHRDCLWFADYLELLGRKDKSLELYNKQEEKLRKAPLFFRGFYEAQALAYCLYSKARLESLMGQVMFAEKDLEAISTCYSKLSEKQQELLNRIPEFFPTFDDLTIAREALSKSEPIPSPPKPTSTYHQNDYDIYGNPISPELHLPEALRCFTLIKERKQADAEIAANELVSAYRTSTPTRAYQLVRQNLFCTVLRIARAFADQGWYASSDKLLVQLESAAKSKIPNIVCPDLSWTMISSEHLYNSMITGKREDWSLLNRTENNVRSSRTDFSLPDKLALLAMAYNYADETSRAVVFIERSIKELNNPGTRDGFSLHVKDPALIYATAACIYAKLSDFTKADKNVDHALARFHEMNDSKFSIFMELATIYNAANRIDKAIYILDQVSKSVPESQIRKYGGKSYYLLAKLYRKSGQPDQALRTIQKVLDSTGTPGHVEEYRMAAELYEQSNNFAEAAKFYFKAGRFNDTQSENSLRKVISCTEKVPDFDKSILSKTYIALSDVARSEDLAKSLALRGKALSLLDDSDPEKPELLMGISDLIRQLSKSESKTISDSRKEIDNPNRSLKALSRLGDEFSVAKQAAELAAMNKSNKTSEYWLRLAYAEAQANLIDSAVKHAQKGIAAYSSENANTHTLYQLITMELPSIIAKAGFPDKAELILEDAQKRVESVAGQGSLPVQVQMSHYFEYLVFQKKDYVKAEKLLDLFLSTNLSQGKYLLPNHYISRCTIGGGPYPVESSFQVLRKLFSVSKKIASGKDNLQALRFLDKILKAEINQFGNDDYRVALTNVEIARMHSSAGESAKAYDAYIAAVKTMHEYEPMQFVLSNVNPDFYGVLQKLDKQSEIDDIEQQILFEQKNLHSRGHRKKRKFAPSR